MLSVSCEACWITHPIPCGLPKEAPPAAVHVPSELYDEGDGEENLEAEVETRLKQAQAQAAQAAAEKAQHDRVASEPEFPRCGGP